MRDRGRERERVDRLDAICKRKIKERGRERERERERESESKMLPE